MRRNRLFTTPIKALRVMMRFVFLVCIFAVVLSCALTRRAGDKQDRSEKSPLETSAQQLCQDTQPLDAITIFLTGNELGAMQPCGCSGGQLGGLDKRAAVLDSVPASKRLIVDVGALVEAETEQDLIKFNIIIQAFELLDYDLVNLTGTDVAIAESLGLLEGIRSVFDVITSQEIEDVNVAASFTRIFKSPEEKLAVTVASLEDGAVARDRIAELFPFGFRPDVRSVNVLILNTRDITVIREIAKLRIVDCFIVPAESDEPEIIDIADVGVLVVTAGRFGKYVGKLDVGIGGGTGELTFGFSAVAVTEDLPNESSLVELYKAYQLLVKQANLLEKRPRFALWGGLEYAGSDSCKSCHEYEYEKWSAKAHAHAYSTLEKVGSQYDPECIICHVVGFEYESGFVSADKTAHLRNVGCECCHGPGSQHIRTDGTAVTTGPMSDCAECHTPENSPDYAGNEQFYFQQITHWKEPNSLSNVKDERQQ